MSATGALLGIVGRRAGNNERDIQTLSAQKRHCLENTVDIFSECGRTGEMGETGGKIEPAAQFLAEVRGVFRLLEMSEPATGVYQSRALFRFGEKSE